jgi:hypothetical protein
MKKNILKTEENKEFYKREKISNSMPDWFNRQTLIVFLGAIVLFFIILIIVNIEPIGKISKFNEKYGAESISDPALLKLMEQEAFLQSRLEMAKTDSICLTLNLLDSTLNLEIEGVVVHSSKLLIIEKSRFLDKTNAVAKINWLKSPFRTISYEASIPKTPITISIAPRDTIEAEQMSRKVVDTIPEYITYSLLLDKGLRIEISQSNDSLPSWARETPSFISKKWGGFKQTVGSLFGVSHDDYVPYIFVEIPFSEARSIYRAIPENALVTITY